MARVAVFAGPVVLVLWIFCVVDVILTRDEDARHLGKIWWLLIVLFFPLAGSVAWLAVGRPRRRRPQRHQHPATGFLEYDRPGRAAGVSPGSDEEFLRRCRERAEEQRRRHRAGPDEPDAPSGSAGAADSSPHRRDDEESDPAGSGG